jgi:hypothetical protein
MDQRLLCGFSAGLGVIVQPIVTAMEFKKNRRITLSGYCDGILLDYNEQVVTVFPFLQVAFAIDSSMDESQSSLRIGKGVQEC